MPLILALLGSELHAKRTTRRPLEHRSCGFLSDRRFPKEKGKYCPSVKAMMRGRRMFCLGSSNREGGIVLQASLCLKDFAHLVHPSSGLCSPCMTCFLLFQGLQRADYFTQGSHSGLYIIVSPSVSFSAPVDGKPEDTPINRARVLASIILQLFDDDYPQVVEAARSLEQNVVKIRPPIV
jgi:hypothetical protein